MIPGLDSLTKLSSLDRRKSLQSSETSGSFPLARARVLSWSLLGLRLHRLVGDPLLQQQPLLLGEVFADHAES